MRFRHAQGAAIIRQKPRNDARKCAETLKNRVLPRLGRLYCQGVRKPCYTTINVVRTTDGLKATKHNSRPT